MKPIRKRLLIHSATLEKVNTSVEWGEENTTDYNLTFVRVDPTAQLVQTKENQVRRLTHVLFYDAVNSQGLPSNQTFEVNDNIIFNGKRHVIISVMDLYDAHEFHHYELGLV